MRDFATFKDFYSNKLMNQEQSTNQLRKKQKELKEEYGARTNQKTIFNNLFALLEAKQQCEESLGNVIGPGSDRSGNASRNPSAGYTRGGGSGGGRGESQSQPGGGYGGRGGGGGGGSRGGEVMSLEDEY